MHTDVPALSQDDSQKEYAEQERCADPAIGRERRRSIEVGLVLLEVISIIRNHRHNPK